MTGVSNAEIAAIIDANYDAFAPAEATLLRMADAMADTPARVSDELYAQLRQHYTEEQLIELATDAGLENLRARFNRFFDIGSDGLCSIMDHREAAAASSR
jgi:alkylhydroperoxidase family enzyme